MRRRELGGSDALALQVLHPLDGLERDDPVAASAPVFLEDRFCLQPLLGQPRRLVGEGVDGVPHDVDVALDEGVELHRVLEEHELHVEPVLLLVERRRAAHVHAAIGHDAGGVTGPGVDSHLERARELAVAHGRAGGLVHRHLAPTWVFRPVGDRVEVALGHLAAGHRLILGGPGLHLGAIFFVDHEADHAQDDQREEDLCEGSELHGLGTSPGEDWKNSSTRFT